MRVLSLAREHFRFHPIWIWIWIWILGARRGSFWEHSPGGSAIKLAHVLIPRFFPFLVRLEIYAVMLLIYPPNPLQRLTKSPFATRDLQKQRTHTLALDSFLLSCDQSMPGEPHGMGGLHALYVPVVGAAGGLVGYWIRGLFEKLLKKDERIRQPEKQNGILEEAAKDRPKTQDEVRIAIGKLMEGDNAGLVHRLQLPPAQDSAPQLPQAQDSGEIQPTKKNG